MEGNKARLSYAITGIVIGVVCSLQQHENLVTLTGVLAVAVIVEYDIFKD